MKMTRDLAEFPNLGEKSARMLALAGIDNEHRLRELGPAIAYLAVRQAGGNPSINLLWAIAAGLQDRHWTDLSKAEKASLRAEIDRLTK